MTDRPKHTRQYLEIRPALKKRWYEWGYQDGRNGDPPTRNTGVLPELEKLYQTGYQAGTKARQKRG